MASDFSNLRPIVIAGHICLDLIPPFTSTGHTLGELIQPGKLLNVGPVLSAPGGCVSNTGLGLHKMGFPVSLCGKIGADYFGGIVRDLLTQRGPGLEKSLIQDPASATSYTVVINPPGVDRVFLHCPGANDTFVAEDLSEESIRGASIFHFGYPPLMRRMFEDGGAELEKVLRKGARSVTSLDMAMPDPDSDAGHADWHGILNRVLPRTDLFLPSFDEICQMLGYVQTGDLESALEDVSQQLLEAGAGVIGIKLGSDGLYIRTSTNPARLGKLAEICNCEVREWAGREILSPCYQVNECGTTGAGDATIAGFLGAVSLGHDPETAASLATAVGACACESPDGTSGIRPWHEITRRIEQGWDRLAASKLNGNWKWTPSRCVLAGPADTH